ncbi:MAG: iron ABC transporter permease [Oscillospiraceae bacterium]
MDLHSNGAPTKPISDYGQLLNRKRGIVLLLMVLLVGVAFLSLSIGSSGITPLEIFQCLLGSGDKQTETVLLNVRLPRIATATVVGAALALSGCVMQSVLRNPLASASTLGVSQGAAFGAALAIVGLDAGMQNAANAGAAITIYSPQTVTICAFLGGLATTAIVLGLSRLQSITPSAMVLAGVALSSLFSGATTLLQYFADDVQVSTVVYWTFGDLGRPSWQEIALIGAITFGAFLFFFYNRWNYNALSSGIQTARSLGVNVSLMSYLSMAVCALTAAVSVAFVGIISFVGLIAPHIMRRFVGTDYRFLLPCSALCGSILLLLGDLFSRTVLSPVILPIGAITSFLGAPLFLYIVFRGEGLK